jgi:hypothetical protein
MALILGLKNTTTQTVPINGLINLGTVYRKNCKRTRSGLPTYVANGNSVKLNGSGIYHITTTLVGTGTAAGVLTAQLYENGVAIPGAISSSTITTANTELRTLVIDYYIKVDSECVLGNWTVAPKTLTLVNTDAGATYTNVLFNVDKVVG